MKTRNLVTVAALMLAAFFTSCDKEQEVINVTGKWYQVINFDCDTSFHFTGKLTIEQAEDGSITGYFIYGGHIPIMVDLNNSYVDGKNIFLSWKFMGNYLNDPTNGNMEFEGKITGNTISGIWYYEGEYQGTWEAVKNNPELKSTYSIPMDELIEKLR